MSLTVYPAAFDQFPERVDGPGQWIMAEHVNFIQDAVTSIEQILGTNPQGSYSTVSARIAAAGGGGEGTRLVRESFSVAHSNSEVALTLHYTPLAIESFTAFMNNLYVQETFFQLLVGNSSGYMSFDTVTGNILLVPNYNGVNEINQILQIEPSGKISALCGNGTTGFSGDGGLAINAQFNNLQCVKAYPTAIFVLDAGNNRIRKIDRSTGIVTTVAGNGSNGTTGDGGQATSASINPGDLAWDPARNFLYMGSYTNMRKVDLNTGVIDRFAGIYNSSGYSGDGGQALSATFTFCNSIAIDSHGNVYFSDLSSAVIRKITQTTNIITKYAGGNGQGYNGDGVAVNVEINTAFALTFSSGDVLYFVDEGNDIIRKIDPGTGHIITITGTPLQSAANGYGPWPMPITTPQTVAGIAFDETNNKIYVNENNTGFGIFDLTAGTWDIFAKGATMSISTNKKTSQWPVLPDATEYANVKDALQKYSLQNGVFYPGAGKVVNAFSKIAPFYSIDTYHVSYLTNDAP